MDDDDGSTDSSPLHFREPQLREMDLKGGPPPNLITPCTFPATHDVTVSAAKRILQTAGL
jgi:hypothetical protein